MIFPNSSILAREPIFLQRQPIGLVGACLGDEVHFEAGFFEHVEWVQRFGDKQALYSDSMLAYGYQYRSSRGDIPVSLPSGYNGAWAEETAIRALRGWGMLK